MQYADFHKNICLQTVLMYCLKWLNHFENIWQLESENSNKLRAWMSYNLVVFSLSNVFIDLMCIVSFLLYSEQTCPIPWEEEDQVDLTDKKHVDTINQQKTFKFSLMWNLDNAVNIWVATKTDQLEGLLWREMKFVFQQPARWLLPPDWLCKSSLQEPLLGNEPCKMTVLQ